MTQVMILSILLNVRGHAATPFSRESGIQAWVLLGIAGCFGPGLQLLRVLGLAGSPTGRVSSRNTLDE